MSFAFSDEERYEFALCWGRSKRFYECVLDPKPRGERAWLPKGAAVPIPGQSF